MDELTAGTEVVFEASDGTMLSAWVQSYSRGWYKVQLAEDGEVISARRASLHMPDEVQMDEMDEVEEEHGAVIRPEWENYIVHKDVKTESGRYAIDNGDDVASLLRGLPLEAAREKAVIAAARLGEDWTVEELADAYSHLNTGHQRMCIGNRLRGAQKRYQKMTAAKQDEQE